MGKIGIIIQREFTQRVRKKSFIITTVLTPLLMIGLMAAPILISQIKSDNQKDVLVVDRSGRIAPELKSDGQMVFKPSDKSYEQIRADRPEDVYGILVIGADIMENPRDVQLYTYGTSTIEAENGIRKQIEGIIETQKLLSYDIANLPEIMEQVKTTVVMQTMQIDSEGKEKESSSMLATGGAYIFGFMIYMFIFLYGAMVLQGVIEEKSSKVMEIIVSSVRPFELMMGKILGIASVAITQFAIWMVLIFVLGTVASQIFAADLAAGAQAMKDVAGTGMAGMGGIDPEAASLLRGATDLGFLGKLFGGFVVFFIGGYLVYAAMFAAIGSAVDDAADTQQLQLPVTIPLILAIVVLMNVLRDPDGHLAFWFSIFPLTSPVIMMARIPYGVPFWQLALSVTLLYASFVGLVWMAGKIYRVGIFMYGKKPTWKELIKWMNYKY